jgi:hypothetical protein
MLGGVVDRRKLDLHPIGRRMLVYFLGQVAGNNCSMNTSVTLDDIEQHLVGAGYGRRVARNAVSPQNLRVLELYMSKHGGKYFPTAVAVLMVHQSCLTESGYVQRNARKSMATGKT